MHTNMLYNTLLFITQQLKDDWTGLWIRLQFCVRTAGGALLYQAYGPNTYNPGGEMNNVLSQRPTICCFSSDSHNYDFIRIKSETRRAEWTILHFQRADTKWHLGHSQSLKTVNEERLIETIRPSLLLRDLFHPLEIKAIRSSLATAATRNRE